MCQFPSRARSTHDSLTVTRYGRHIETVRSGRQAQKNNGAPQPSTPFPAIQRSAWAEPDTGEETVKKILAIAAVAMLLVLSVLPSASAAGAVVGTYSVADLGQGIWGGGPLFADGTAGGVVAL